MMRGDTEIAEMIGKAALAVEALRRQPVRVHCLTSPVAQPLTANLLLAAGAIPSMTSSPQEIAFFARRSDSLLVNLGMLDLARMEAIRIAIESVAAEDRPFVLDPVKCYVSPPRLEFAREILGADPAIIRVNLLEAEALSDDLDGSKGCRVVTGATDTISWQETRLCLRNGHEWLERITAAGCAQGALMAALLPVAADRRIAALAAILWVNLAAERAATLADGPGSFQAAWIDSIFALDPADFAKKARLA